jgi:hypothetical protein
MALWGGDMVKAAVLERVKDVLFRVRWLTMSDRQRYAYLWNRTKESL